MTTTRLLFLVALAGWATAAWFAADALRTPHRPETAGQPPSASADSVAGEERGGKEGVGERGHTPERHAEGTGAETSAARRTSVSAGTVDSLHAVSPRLRSKLLHAFVQSRKARLDALSELGLQPVNGDFRSMLEQADSDEGKLGNRMGIIRLWAQHDPAALGRWLQSQDDVSLLKYGAHAVARVWAKRDVFAAVEWSRGLPKGRARDFALRECIGPLAERFPDVAAEALEEIGKDTFRISATSNLVQGWYESDPQEAMEWLLGRPSGQDRDRGLATLAGQMAEGDPLSAISLALEIEDGSTVDRAISNVVGQWAEGDVQAAADFVRSLPEGGARDQAVLQIARKLAETNAASAFEWASTISDDAHKERARSIIASVWISRDPGAALEWLEDASLSEQQKERLREFAERASQRNRE